jgi:hypothetical protein
MRRSPERSAKRSALPMGKLEIVYMVVFERRGHLGVVAAFSDQVWAELFSSRLFGTEVRPATHVPTAVHVDAMLEPAKALHHQFKIVFKAPMEFVEYGYRVHEPREAMTPLDVLINAEGACIEYWVWEKDGLQAIEKVLERLADDMRAIHTTY